MYSAARSTLDSHIKIARTLVTQLEAQQAQQARLSLLVCFFQGVAAAAAAAAAAAITVRVAAIIVVATAAVVMVVVIVVVVAMVVVAGHGRGGGRGGDGDVRGGGSDGGGDGGSGSDWVVVACIMASVWPRTGTSARHSMLARDFTKLRLIERIWLAFGCFRLCTGDGH